MRMSNHTAEKGLTQLDLSDVDHRVGQRCGGGQLWEPCRPSDIRRWVMALDYPNPIHWDEEFAQNTKFGGIIAPQSMAIALDIGHGVQPACVGRIPGSHLIFGGEEWWHYGQPIRPGDQLFQERRFHDYKVTDTKFAGPTMFARGDTIHRNQNGALVAKVRATSIRYLAEEAKKRSLFQNQSAIPKWTPEALRRVEMIRHDWIMSNRVGLSPHFDELKAGDKLPRRAIGPHSIASFTTEYRAFLENMWGSYRWVGVPGMKDPWINQDAGWVKGFTTMMRARKSTRVTATDFTKDHRPVMSMAPKVARSAFRAAMVMARQWARGRPIISPTGLATMAWFAIRRCRTARRPLRAMSPMSMVKSPESRRTPCGGCHWYRSTCK